MKPFGFETLEKLLEFGNNIRKRIPMLRNNQSTCLLLGIIISCIHFRFEIDKYHKIKNISVEQWTIVEGFLYTAFVSAFGWMNTYFLLGYMSHLMSLMKKDFHDHLIIKIFLAYSTGFLANVIWFKVLQYASIFSVENASKENSVGLNSSKKMWKNEKDTVDDLLLSWTPVILTSILLLSSYLMGRFRIKPHIL